MEENFEIESGDVSFNERIATFDNEQQEVVADTNYVDDYVDVPTTSNNGNLHIMIIVVAVCAVLGIVLGIIAGRRAANK